MPVKSLSIKWDLEKGDRVRIPVQRRKQLWRAANRQYVLEKRTAPNLAPSCLTFEVNSESCTLVLSLELACKPTGAAPAMRDSPMCRKHGIALQCPACTGAKGSQRALSRVSRKQLSEWGKQGNPRAPKSESQKRSGRSKTCSKSLATTAPSTLFSFPYSHRAQPSPARLLVCSRLLDL